MEICDNFSLGFVRPSSSSSSKKWRAAKSWSRLPHLIFSLFQSKNGPKDGGGQKKMGFSRDNWKSGRSGRKRGGGGGDN